MDVGAHLTRMLGGGGCGVLALALGVLSTSSWALAAAERNGERLAGSAT